MVAESTPRSCVVRSDGTPEGTSIVIDGVELTDVCTDLVVRLLPGAPPLATATLEVRVTVLELLERKGNMSLFKVCANCAKELTAPPRASVPPAAETAEQG